MTISYSKDVATANVGVFARLLFRWKGSVYKFVWRHVIIFAVAYGAVAIVYRALLDCRSRE